VANASTFTHRAAHQSPFPSSPFFLFFLSTATTFFSLETASAAPHAVQHAHARTRRRLCSLRGCALLAAAVGDHAHARTRRWPWPARAAGSAPCTAAPCWLLLPVATQHTRRLHRKAAALARRRRTRLLHARITSA